MNDLKSGGLNHDVAPDRVCHVKSVACIWKTGGWIVFFEIY